MQLSLLAPTWDVCDKILGQGSLAWGCSRRRIVTEESSEAEGEESAEVGAYLIRQDPSRAWLSLGSSHVLLFAFLSAKHCPSTLPNPVSQYPWVVTIRRRPEGGRASGPGRKKHRKKHLLVLQLPPNRLANRSKVGAIPLGTPKAHPRFIIPSLDSWKTTPLNSEQFV